MDLFGIWAEEIDVLPQWMKQSVEAVADNPLDLAGSFAARHYAEVLHLRGATPIATYTKEYYAGTPAVTVHKHGKGRAIYIASRNDDAFTDALIASLIQQHAIRPTLSAPLPPGVSATYRTDAQHDYVFVMNLTTDEKSVPLDAHPYQDALTLAPVSGPLNLASYETRVLIRPSRK